VLHISQNVTFCFGIFNKVLSQNLLFAQYLHCIVFSFWCYLLCLRVNLEFFNQINDTETALAQLHQGFKIFGPNNLLGLVRSGFVFLLPNCNKSTVEFRFLFFQLQLQFLVVAFFLFLLRFKSVHQDLFIAKTLR
jgi:hypothetical protein